jgi:flagellar biosynthetic protein FlhB
MSSSGQEKTEQPTDRRKKEARNKGTVAKSVDMISAAVLVTLLMALPSIMTTGFQGFTHGFRSAVRATTNNFSLANVDQVTRAALFPMLPPLVTVMAIAMLVGLIGNFAQVGFNLSGEAMKPNFNKINPANGFKRLFSKTAAFDMVKSLVKLFLFSWMVYTSVRDHWAQIGMIWSLTPIGSLSVIGGLARTIMMRVGIAWLVLAVGDYVFQKKQTNQQLMMTKEEVRQEMKDAESSPEMKGHRMRMARKFSKMRLSQAVQEADVIITNPTHFAVAIKYEASKNHAPVVVAKGVDHLAFRIRELAKDADIPIVENRPLARALHKQCEVGDFVPRELFQSVAEVLAFIYKTSKKFNKSA